MKKNYITPKTNLTSTNIEYSICTASIMNGGEFTQHGEIPDARDPFDVGTKNRFYNDSEDEGWD